MIYDISKLQNEEVKELTFLLEKYKDFDKIDILIGIVLDKFGVSCDNFNRRSRS